MFKLIFRYLQKRKEKFSPEFPGIRQLENRKYLTMSGIKNFDELTLKDKLQLNIKI